MAKLNFRACTFIVYRPSMLSESSRSPACLISRFAQIRQRSTTYRTAHGAQLTAFLNTAVVTDYTRGWDETVSSWTRQDGQTSPYIQFL